MISESADMPERWRFEQEVRLRKRKDNFNQQALVFVAIYLVLWLLFG